MGGERGERQLGRPCRVKDAEDVARLAAALRS